MQAKFNMMVINVDLKEKAKNLTTAPGVYLEDSLSNVIYIGKAKSQKQSPNLFSN